MHLPPDKSMHTELRRTCPWCGYEFASPLAMQQHEPNCDRWDDRCEQTDLPTSSEPQG